MGYYDSDRERLKSLVTQTQKEALNGKLEQIRAEYPSNPELVYPCFAGCLQFFAQELSLLAERLDTELEQARRHNQAMQWAAEHTLTDRVEAGTYGWLEADGTYRSARQSPERWEVFYEAVEIVEKALKEGMSLDRLREHLKDGITEQEYAQQRFLDPDEVCTD